MFWDQSPTWILLASAQTSSMNIIYPRFQQNQIKHQPNPKDDWAHHKKQKRTWYYDQKTFKLSLRPYNSHCASHENLTVILWGSSTLSSCPNYANIFMLPADSDTSPSSRQNLIPKSGGVKPAASGACQGGKFAPNVWKPASHHRRRPQEINAAEHRAVDRVANAALAPKSPWLLLTDNPSYRQICFHFPSNTPSKPSPDGFKLLQAQREAGLKAETPIQGSESAMQRDRGCDHEGKKIKRGRKLAKEGARGIQGRVGMESRAEGARKVPSAHGSMEARLARFLNYDATNVLSALPLPTTVPRVPNHRFPRSQAGN